MAETAWNLPADSPPPILVDGHRCSDKPECAFASNSRTASVFSNFRGTIWTLMRGQICRHGDGCLLLALPGGKMTTQNRLTEEELEEAFREDAEFGLELLHEEFRDRIARYIKKCGPSLTPDEIHDLYQDTMLEMVGHVRSPSFNPERPLRLVQTRSRRGEPSTACGGRRTTMPSYHTWPRTWVGPTCSFAGSTSTR